MDQFLYRTNNVLYKQYFSKDGGTHLSGFRSALTRTLNSYSNKNNGKNRYEITGDDCREGLVAILSIKMSDPKFSSQTKINLCHQKLKHSLNQHYLRSFLNF